MQKSSSRVGESSCFNISKKMKKRNNAGLGLQLFEDASCEIAVFGDLPFSVVPPWENSKIAIFE